MFRSSDDKSRTASTPFDLTTLQERIQREIIGISALSDFLVAFGKQSTGPGTAEQRLAQEQAPEVPSTQPKMHMIRVRLDAEFWVDMTPDQVSGFLSRKEASLRAVEERRENLAQLQEWMIRELQDMGTQGPQPFIKDEDDDVSKRGTGSSQANATTSTDHVTSANPTQVTKSSAPRYQAASSNSTSKTAPSVSSSSAVSPQGTATQPVVTKETIKQLEDINSALSKFGTSMEEVLKLDSTGTPSDGSGGTQKGTEVGQDGTVLNEEGLPFLDIREDLSASVETEKAGVSTTTEETFAAEPLPVDDYWSEEAVERRRKLRESIFGSDDDDDEEEDDENESNDETEGTNRERMREEGEVAPKMSDTPVASKKPTPSATNTDLIPLPEPEMISPPPKAIVKGKAAARKPGFMARSTVIDHSQEKEAIEDSGAGASVPFNQSVDSSAKSTPSAEVSKTIPTSTASAMSPTVSEISAPSERRKSVTFNPQTRVRLYEKGEIMPNAASTPTTPKVETTSRFELLPDDDKSAQALPVAKPVTTVKARDSGVFSGFKKGFLESARPAKPVQTAIPTPAKIASPLISRPTTASAEPTINENPEYHQPLAPAHEKPVRAKKQSVFSQRKAEAQNKREQLMNFSSFDPMPSPRDAATPITSVGTGASTLVNPMKMSVVEKATAPATAPTFANPGSGPIPTAPSAQQFPPNVKKQTAVKEAVMERKPPVIAPPISHTEESLHSADETHTTGSATDSDSPPDDFEYSDGEDAFDMDEALLAREAALAYHAKRSALGRAGLGGWTGRFGPDGEVEWDTEVVPMSAGMDEAPPRTGPVAFGERIIPVGMEGLRLPAEGDVEGDSSDDEAGQDGVSSISLPQVIPASENLASAIKIGKLENGNLVVQDADDSDDEEDEHDRSVEDTTTPEERAARAQAAEERRQRKAMIDRLRRGDVSAMIREEQQREEEFLRQGGGYVEPPVEAPPALSSTRSGTESQQVSEKKSTFGKDVVESSGMGASKVLEPPVAPKKVSRFKAARMAAN